MSHQVECYFGARLLHQVVLNRPVQVLSINLVGNNKVVDVGSHLFDTGRPIVTLCAGVDYTLEGNYSLLGVCSNVPPFSATLTADGNAIYSPSGLNDTYSVPIPISVTSIVGAQPSSLQGSRPPANYNLNPSALCMIDFCHSAAS